MIRMDEEQAVLWSNFKQLQAVEFHSIRDLQQLQHSKGQQYW